MEERFVLELRKRDIDKLKGFMMQMAQEDPTVVNVLGPADLVSYVIREGIVRCKSLHENKTRREGKGGMR